MLMVSIAIIIICVLFPTLGIPLPVGHIHPVPKVYHRLVAAQVCVTAPTSLQPY